MNISKKAFEQSNDNDLTFTQIYHVKSTAPITSNPMRSCTPIPSTGAILNEKSSKADIAPIPRLSSAAIMKNNS